MWLLKNVRRAKQKKRRGKRVYAQIQQTIFAAVVVQQVEIRYVIDITKVPNLPYPFVKHHSQIYVDGLVIVNTTSKDGKH